MKVCYINLDSAGDRRDALERNFALYNKHCWPLERFAAIDTNRLGNYDFPFSRIRDVEAACFLSHLEALRYHARADEDLLLVEDDVAFGPGSQDLIELIVRNTPRNAWDIIFTDICVTNLNTMLWLYDLRRQLNSPLRLLDLFELTANFPAITFAGSSGYVVNKERIGGLAGRLATQRDITLPYDICLNKLIHDKVIFAHAIFPFPTTLAASADASQIRPRDAGVTDILWNSFRRLMWCHGDPAEAEKTLAQIGEAYFDDPFADIMAKIVKGLIGRKFRERPIHL